jgi:bifunctional lysine-specific demethylase and histidyl-hydroxylase MINA
MLQKLIGPAYAFRHFFENGHIDHLYSPASPATRAARALLGSDPDRAMQDDEAELRRYAEFRSLSKQGDASDTEDYHSSRRGFAEESRIHNRTLTFKSIGDLFPRIRTVKRALELAFAAPVSTNLYYSPGGARGSGLHYDTKDIFAVQLRGSKHWQVETGKRKYPSLWWDRPGDPHMPAPDPSRYLFHTVRAGDLLYIPAGHWHEATAAAEGSIHVSIGFRPMTVRDSIIALLDHLSDEDMACRTFGFGIADPRSGMWDEVSSAKSWGRITDLVTCQAGRLHDRAVPIGQDLLRRVLTAKRAKFINDLPFMPAEVSEAAIDDIDGETPVGLRALMIAEVTADRAGATLHYPGGTLSGPPQIAPALRHMLGHARFVPNALPGALAGKAKLMLVQKLVRRGVLERAAESRSRGHAAVPRDQGLGAAMAGA